MKKIVYILSFFIWCNANAQNINKSKDELNSFTSKNSGNSKKSSRSSGVDINSDDGFFLLKLAGYLTIGIVKYGLIGDYESESHLKNNLTQHPFSSKGRGNYAQTDSVKSKNFRIDLENHFIKSGSGIFANHFNLNLRPSKYFYFKTDYYELFEQNLFTNQKDRLSLLYFNVGYDRVRTEKFNLGWTLGMSYLGNGINSAGLSYGVNATYFLKQNMSFSVATNGSRINFEPVNSLVINSKYYKKNFFGSLAFERLKIATPVYHFVGIGGGIHF